MSTVKQYRKKPVVIDAMRMPTVNDNPLRAMEVYLWIENNTPGFL